MSEDKSTEEKPAALIFGDEELSDVILVVDNQDFKTNKTILADRIDVFKAMFYGDFNKSKEDRVEIKEDRVELKDVSVNNFRRLLELIYTGKISNTSQFLEFPFRMKYNDHESMLGFKTENLRKYFHNFWNDTTELLKIADRFNLTPMVKDYFESVIIPAMRICRDQACPQCFNYLIFSILNGMDLSRCEKRYKVGHFKEWIKYADEEPFPDVPNKAVLVLLQNLNP